MATFRELDQPSKDLVTAVEEKADALFAAMKKSPPNAAEVLQAQNVLDLAIDGIVVAINA